MRLPSVDGTSPPAGVLGWDGASPAACPSPRKRLCNWEQRKRRPHVQPLRAATQPPPAPGGRVSFPSGSREGNCSACALRRCPTTYPSAKPALGCCGGTPEASLAVGPVPKELRRGYPKRGEHQGRGSEGDKRGSVEGREGWAVRVITSGYFFGGVWIFLRNCTACVFCPAVSLLPCGYEKMFFSQKMTWFPSPSPRAL